MAKLPPLNLLQTIEAVVRCGSFKLAAEELLITPSAVSHRIKSLEAMAGQPLFRREGQGVIATEDALRLSRVIAESNRQIARGWESVCEAAGNRRYLLSCMAAFAEHFIFSRIDEFVAQFPNVQLALTSSLDFGLAMTHQPDMIVGFGQEPQSGWEVQRIYRPSVQVVASRRMADQVLRDGTLHGPLLGYYTNKDVWGEIADKLGFALHPDAKVMFFDSIASTSAAIANNVGAAILPVWAIADHELNHDALVRIGEPFPSPGGYYWLAMDRSHKHLNIMTNMARWLRRSVADAE